MTFGVAHHPSFIDTIRQTIAESYKDKIFHFTNTMTIQITETNQGNDKKSSSKASKTPILVIARSILLLIYSIFFNIHLLFRLINRTIEISHNKPNNQARNHRTTRKFLNQGAPRLNSFKHCEEKAATKHSSTKSKK